MFRNHVWDAASPLSDGPSVTNEVRVKQIEICNPSLMCYPFLTLVWLSSVATATKNEDTAGADILGLPYYFQPIMMPAVQHNSFVNKVNIVLFYIFEKIIALVRRYKGIISDLIACSKSNYLFVNRQVSQFFSKFILVFYKRKKFWKKIIFLT